MHINQITIDEETEFGRYYLACARIRDISMSALVKRLIEAIAEDQLVTAILDDDSSKQRRRGEHRYYTSNSFRRQAFPSRENDEPRCA